MLDGVRDKYRLVPLKRELNATSKGVNDHKYRSIRYHMKGSLMPHEREYRCHLQGSYYKISCTSFVYPFCVAFGTVVVQKSEVNFMDLSEISSDLHPK